MPFLGFGLFGALSGTFIYAPELFPPSVRATAMAVCNSVGRYVTALGPLTAGAIAVSWFDGNLGMATASVTALGLIAVVGLAFARETRGEPLPTDPTIPRIPSHREEPVMSDYTGASAHRHRRLDRRPDHRPAAARPGIHGRRLRTHPDRAGRPRQRHRPAARHRALVHRAQHPEPGRPFHLHLLRAVPRPRPATWSTGRSAPGPTPPGAPSTGPCSPTSADRALPLRRVRLRLRSIRRQRDGPVRQRQGGVRRPGGVRRRRDLGGARAVRPDAGLRYSGYIGWRGTLAGPRPRRTTREVLQDAITYDVVPHSHITMYPIPGENGLDLNDRLMNYVWYRNVPAGPELTEMLHRQAGIHRRGVRAPRPGPGPLRRRDEAGRRRTTGARGGRGGHRHRDALRSGGVRCPVLADGRWAGSR